MNRSRKIAAIIEARMTSTRLPGKVMMEVNGKPMLSYLVDRLKQVEQLDEIVLATTQNESDDCLCDFSEKENISLYRGSEQDVMSRVIEAAEMYGAEIIVEITGDCPIIDPLIIDYILNVYLENNYDYVANDCSNSYPVGMDVQVYSLDVLRKSSSMTEDALDREHVTRHILNNDVDFKKKIIDAPGLGLTLDELNDFRLIAKIIQHFGSDYCFFGCEDVIDLLSDRSEWVSINGGVYRKTMDD